MLRKVFAVKDLAAETFGQPFFCFVYWLCDSYVW